MALHDSYVSMLGESLDEIVAVAEYSITSEKPGTGPLPGCYGYPGATLLLCIVDTIGGFVLGGRVEKHFQVLNDPNYYGLNLPKAATRAMYDQYRNNLSHSSVLGLGFYLDKGTAGGPVYETRDGVPYLNLVPFLGVSKKVVSRFLKVADKIVPQSQIFKNLVAAGKSIGPQFTSISATSMPASGIGPLPPDSGSTTPRK